MMDDAVKQGYRNWQFPLPTDFEYSAVIGTKQASNCLSDPVSICLLFLFVIV